MRRAWFLLLALPLQGCFYTRQDVENPPPLPFRFTIFPYPTYDGDEGLQGWITTGWRRPTNRLPPPVSEALMFNARIATSGTRGISVAYDRPGRSRAWRLYGHLAAERLNRAPYYGVGNETPEIDSLNDLDPPYYRYQLYRTTAYGVYQREVVSHVRLHIAAQARYYHARPLGPTTLYAEDIAAGIVPESGSASTGELRLGLIYDSRDEEATPSRGLFLEGMAVQSVGDHEYNRYLLGGRLFVPLNEVESWVLGLRETTEFASGDVPFYVSYERLTTWYLEDGFGGQRSLRLQPPGRYVAAKRYVASADLRHKILDIPKPSSPVRVWALAFGDVGRLWNVGESVSIGGLHWSAGVGGRLQISKGTVFGMDVGGTDGGAGFAISSTFAF